MARGMDVFIAPMRCVGLFRGLSDDQLVSIARRAERTVFQSGEPIVSADTQGDAAILIVGGDAVRVSGPVYSGDVEDIECGSLVAEMAMLVEIEHASTIIARGQVRALRFTRKDMSELMTRDPGLADHFLGTISQRLADVARDLRAANEPVAAGFPAPRAEIISRLH